MTNTFEEELLKYENLILAYANKFHYYYDIEDLKQVGMIGLKKAYDNYKENSNTKFSSYAYLWIKGEILKYIREDRNIKTNRNLLKIAKIIEDVSNTLRHKLLREPTLEEISLFSEIDISLIQEALMSKQFVLSFDYIVNSDDGDKDVNLYDAIPYQEKGFNEDVLDLKEALTRLPEEEQRLIKYRYFEDMTQSETSKMMGLSQVKVSREESKILQKLRKEVA